MKVVSLCNKLSRSKNSLLKGDAEPETQAAAEVSNNTTGATMEVNKYGFIFIYRILRGKTGVLLLSS